jgi:hypothetical protein
MVALISFSGQAKYLQDQNSKVPGTRKSVAGRSIHEIKKLGARYQDRTGDLRIALRDVAHRCSMRPAL